MELVTFTRREFHGYSRWPVWIMLPLKGLNRKEVVSVGLVVYESVLLVSSSKLGWRKLKDVHV